MANRVWENEWVSSCVVEESACCRYIYKCTRMECNYKVLLADMSKTKRTVNLDTRHPLKIIIRTQISIWKAFAYISPATSRSSTHHCSSSWRWWCVVQVLRDVWDTRVALLSKMKNICFIRLWHFHPNACGYDIRMYIAEPPPSTDWS